jgi:hypothetical protein
MTAKTPERETMHESRQIRSLLSEFRTRSTTSSTDVRDAEQALDRPLPSDYRQFLLQETNGGEGFIGQNYVVLWKAEELSHYNHDYESHKYAPELILFGSNGAGEGFAFDTRTSPYRVVMVPFIGLSRRDAIVVAANFQEFLKRCSVQESLFDG